MAWRCDSCGEWFDEPLERRSSIEVEYGVSSFFGDSHSCTIDCCPYCDSEDIEEMPDDYEEEEEEEDE